MHKDKGFLPRTVKIEKSQESTLTPVSTRTAPRSLTLTTSVTTSMWDAVFYSQPVNYLQPECLQYSEMHNQGALTKSGSFEKLLKYKNRSAPYTPRSSISSASDDCGAGTSSSSGRQQVCSICTDAAEGFHFGAIACAACGAFFRRSISDQKVYSCATRKCAVRGDAHKRGGICRYCRFEKCLAAGMMPTEVQLKRVVRSASQSASSTSDCYCLAESQTSRTATLETIVQIRRDLAQRRASCYCEQNLISATLPTQFRCMDVDFELFNTFIIGNPIFNLITKHGDQLDTPVKPEPGLPTSWNALPKNSVHQDIFFMFCVFEMSVSTSVLGGVQLDRCVMPNTCSVDVSISALTKYFATDEMIKDPNCLARLCHPFFAHIVRVNARALQAANLDETETAFLFFISLSQAASLNYHEHSDDLGSVLLEEIANHYDDAGIDVSAKMGNLLLFVTLLIQSLKDFKEYILLAELARY